MSVLTEFLVVICLSIMLWPIYVPFIFATLVHCWINDRLSMVTANGVTAVARPNLRTTYRKMADIGVQYEPQEANDMSPFSDPEPPVVSSTVAVAEINTSAEPSEPPTHRPLSFQSSTSSSGSSGEEKEKKKACNAESEDVDAICVQQTESVVEDDVTEKLTKDPEKFEVDGFYIPEKPDTSCGLDCLYLSMKCCECTIL